MSRHVSICASELATSGLPFPAMRTCRAGLLAPLLLGLLATPLEGKADPLPSLDLRNFQPPTDPDGSLYLEPAITPGAGQWNTAGILSWGYRPVVLRDGEGDIAAKLVRHQLAFDFVAGTGIGKRGALGLVIPAVLAQDGEVTPQTSTILGDSSLPAQALGDLALTGKAALIPYAEMGGFGLATLARVTLPTGDQTSYAGEGALTSEVRLLAEMKLIAIALQATAGFKLRTEEREFAGETWGNEIPWGAAISVRPQAFGLDPDGHWTWTVETHGALPAGPSSPFSSKPLSPALIGASARYAIRDVSVLAGVEGPLDGAVGVPLVRGVLAIAWAPRPHDMDHDGVGDDTDDCPELEEDRDGFEDTDGCPDFDNDNDGALDHEDRCPGALEDLDDFMDEDGCPDFDNDRDGIPDEQDQCPSTWGVRSADPTSHGCPVVDKDSDGTPDGADRCPNDAEDRDGFEDDDGCPDTDNDGDGVEDGEDRCPLSAGPASSNPKWNGCPIPDKDGDTFDDEADKCPSEAEVWNGVNDNDGCPDQGGAPLVTVQATQTGPALRLRQAIQFHGAPAAPEVSDKSLPSLRAVAAELNRHPSWVVAVGCRPKRAHGAFSATHALSRSFAVVLALRTYTFRDGVAETVGWNAVKDQPGAWPTGVGFLVLGQAPSDPGGLKKPKKKGGP